MSQSPTPPVPRVVVGVGDSPGCLTVLGRAAHEARLRGAELWAVAAWEPPEGGLAARRFPAAAATVPEWERLAGERLGEALRDAFGGYGSELPGRALVVRGAPGPALVRMADRDGDLLVVGAGTRGRLHRALWPSVGRYCLARALCPVLAVPPSPLRAALTAAHRRNSLRLRLDTGHLERELESLPPDA
ncbi:universal stress protein [Streptomyces sp. f51]|uniref:universal stress protein n=1 Tax=Streptomyces sp. f51 TaxID=1827742 RepID=UPI0030D38AE1